jgi:uncharacterized protein YcbX
MAEIVVTGLAVTPVKAMRIQPVDAIELGERGASGNRRFYVIDERGEMVNGKRLGALQTIVSTCENDELVLAFTDGREIRGALEYGETLSTGFFSRPRPVRALDGPWSEALSDFAGEPLRLVDAGSAVDRGRTAGVSLVSRGSLSRLAEVADTDSVDVRRFRMLIEIDGVAPHEEDGWVGRRVRIGPALVAMHGHIGRCMVTTRNPETGEVDFSTLHALASYRREHPSAEPLPFGIYGEVLEGGAVRVGDPVALDG